MRPGGTLLIQTPVGADLEIVVPEGMAPGDTFEVTVAGGSPSVAEVEEPVEVVEPAAAETDEEEEPPPPAPERAGGGSKSWKAAATALIGGGGAAAAGVGYRLRVRVLKRELSERRTTVDLRLTQLGDRDGFTAAIPMGSLLQL